MPNEHLTYASLFCDDPPGVLERLDSRGRGVLILLEALRLLCRCIKKVSCVFT